MLEIYEITENGTYGPFIHSGGRLVASAVGNFGGGVLSVQVDHGVGYTEEAAWTADESGVVDAATGSRIQFVLAGATSPNLNACGRS